MTEAARPGDKGGASKYDAGKIPVYQGFEKYFPRAIMAIAMVSEYGFRKYGSWGGWRDVPDGVSRYTDAKARHARYQDIEGPYDLSDSGLPHAAQEAWNALAKLDKQIELGEVRIMRGNEIELGKPVLGTARQIALPSTKISSCSDISTTYVVAEAK